jgi:hypothetical protein
VNVGEKNASVLDENSQGGTGLLRVAFICSVSLTLGTSYMSVG